MAVQLQFDGVSRIFGEDPPIIALGGVDLVVAAGDFVAVQGPSGSGKSTLLNLLALIDQPTAGHYRIGELDATGLSERRRAQLRSDTFGFVFQNFHLMPHRSARENVELGLLYRGVRPAERRRLARAALAAVGLSSRESVAASKLSGGERQRVAIARATVAGAPILVADEPTGNLDSRNGEVIVSQLLALNAAGTTVVLVTHDQSVAARAKRQVRLADGRTIPTEHPQPSRVPVAETAPAVPRTAAGRPSRLRPPDLVRESVRALQQRPGRTALLVAAIGIAVALVVITMGLAQTAAAQVSSSFDVTRNREVSITVPMLDQSQAGSSQTGSPQPSSPHTGSPQTGVPIDVAQRLSQVHGIVTSGVLESYDQVAAQAVGQPVLPQATLIGISPGLLDAADATVEWAPGHSHNLGVHELLVGTFAAADLQLGPVALDPVVRIGGVDYGVAGLVERSDRAPQLASALLVDWRQAAELSRLNGSTVLLTTAGGAAAQVARQAPIAIDPVAADAMQVSAPPDPTSLRASVQGDVRAALLALTLVAMLASILSVANAMLLNVLERVGELGLRRAIGARPFHILNQTSLEALLAGVLGGAGGLLAGLGTVLAITVINRWQPVLDLRLVPLALLGGMVVGMLGGLPASFRASRIQPSDALRR